MKALFVLFSYDFWCESVDYTDKDEKRLYKIVWCEKSFPWLFHVLFCEGKIWMVLGSPSYQIGSEYRLSLMLSMVLK
jgi:hypothetical protein